MLDKNGAPKRVWKGSIEYEPTAEEIAAEEDNIKIAKVNVDDSPDLARRYEIMSIPALIVFENGEPAKKLIGAKPKGALLEEIGEFL